MPISISPALIKPAPMAHTPIQPGSAMRSPRKTAVAIQGTNWTQLPGSASGAAAAPDGSLWVLSDQPAGADKYIWHYTGGTWTNVPGLADHLAVAPDGTLYAINAGGGVYAYSSGTWTALGGGADSVTVASDGSVYVTSNAGSGDQAIWHYAGGAWSQVPGAGAVLAASWDTKNYTLSNGTVSADGTYILNAEGSIYYENANNTFVQLPGAASAIAPTKSGGVFVLGYPASASGEALYYYNLDSPGWTAESGAGVSISTDGSTLYVVGASGAIYSSPVTAAPTPSAGESLAIASDPSSAIGIYTAGASTASATISAASLGLQTFSPDILGLDAQNNLYVADNGSAQVLRFAPPYGNNVSVVTSYGPNTIEGMTVTATGTVFVAPFQLGYSQFWTQPVEMYAPPSGTATNLSIPANTDFAPYCLTLDAGGDLFATNIELSTGDPGTLEYAPPYTGSPTTYPFGGNWGYPAAPQPGGGCALDTSNGELFVAYASTIEAYAPPYTGAATVINEGAIGTAELTVSSANHDLFVANGTSVDVYAPPYTSKTATITNGANQPNIVAADASGNLFVASVHNGTVTEYAPPYTGAPVWTLNAFQTGVTWLIPIQ